MRDNGIIENYAGRTYETGYEFCSETDTGGAGKAAGPQLSRRTAGRIPRTLEQVRGSYGLAILFKDFPGQIFSCARKPSIVGYGAGETFSATFPLCCASRDYAVLEEARSLLSADKIDVYDAFGHR
ncbi:MAG: hypothetical protein ACLRZH_07440 [Ruthenibacterium lactatiformans]